MKKQASIDHQRRAAFHEAGHAIVRWALLGECARVEIFADGSGAAQWSTGGSTIDERGRCEAEIMIYMSGFMAEARAMNVTEQYARLTGGDGDRARIVEMFDLAIANGWTTDYETAANTFEQRTRGLLAQHWMVVERVADALVQHKALRADELREVITRPSAARRRSAFTLQFTLSCDEQGRPETRGNVYVPESIRNCVC